MATTLQKGNQAPRRQLEARIANRRGRLRIGVWLLVAALVLVICGFGLAIYGQVRGEEFSPQRFTMRKFSYVQIPLLRIQVWPVRVTRITGQHDKLASHIRRTTRVNGLMNRVRSTPGRWDIVSMHEIGSTPYRGDASILVNYLKQPGAQGMESWLDWSIAHPKLAGVLWGVVANLANEDLYPIIPEVLEAARRLDAATFEKQLRQTVSTECQAFAKAYTADGDPKRAAAISNFAKLVLSEQFRVGDQTSNTAPAETADAESFNAETADVSADLP